MSRAAWLTGEFDLITGAHAWKCCGVATETTEALREYNARPQIPYAITQVTSNQLIAHSGHDVQIWACPNSGKEYIKVYPDGSLVNGGSLWRARASWAIWVGPDHPANDSGEVSTPCFFRAGLIGIFEIVKRAVARNFWGLQRGPPPLPKNLRYR